MPKSRLFYIRDKNPGFLFLVDIGAQISVIPAKSNMSTRKTDYTLQAANGSSIQAYGETSLTLNLGFRRSFPWVFTIAQARTLILEVDFLAHFKLSVNMSSLSLEDRTTNFTRKVISSIYTSTMSATLPEANGMQYLLKKYSQITTPFRQGSLLGDQTHFFLSSLIFLPSAGKLRLSFTAARRWNFTLNTW
ncbi:unnamed protein product [Acanthosepion pharaonis]|uniref:Peptidase A2 domain-containing protein n=1 Tax=Acanthosepion pharaonis TaxID=158019 RepID=A0A812AT30_ACAPH|nr:unnamed protein product [Sepia pharaonis]